MSLLTRAIIITSIIYCAIYIIDYLIVSIIAVVLNHVSELQLIFSILTTAVIKRLLMLS